MTVNRRSIVIALAAGLAVATAGCAADPAPSLTPVPTVTPTVIATPSPKPTPSAALTPAPAPDGTVLAPVPPAGIALPVPRTWEQVGAEVLADPAGRADLVARYPGTAGLLEAADELGDRAAPAFIALDPAPTADGAAITPNIAVLVAQPAVSGLLLDLVAGFIADGYREAFGSGEPVRERVTTPIGEAVRLSFEIPVDDGAPLRATAWVVGAESGTLLISVIGPLDDGPSSEPDALIDAAIPQP